MGGWGPRRKSGSCAGALKNKLAAGVGGEGGECARRLARRGGVGVGLEVASFRQGEKRDGVNAGDGSSL